MFDINLVNEKQKPLLLSLFENKLLSFFFLIKRYWKWRQKTKKNFETYVADFKNYILLKNDTEIFFEVTYKSWVLLFLSTCIPWIKL